MCGVKREPVTLNTYVTAMFCGNFLSKLFTLKPCTMDPQKLHFFHSSNSNSNNVVMKELGKNRHSPQTVVCGNMRKGKNKRE